MKYLRQFMIIMIISFVGEVLKYLIPLPVPASIYGLVIMLVLLQTNLLPLESIKEAGLFLVEIMPVMFIPAAVGFKTDSGSVHCDHFLCNRDCIGMRRPCGAVIYPQRKETEERRNRGKVR